MMAQWDTAGQEKFRSVASNIVRNAQGVLLVYDITDSSTFSAIPEWLDFINRLGHPDAVKVLVGNKLDQSQHRVVSTDKGQVRFASPSVINYNQGTLSSCLKILSC